MSRPVQLPVSELIKRGKTAGEEDQATKRKRNDFREQKELEEQRKAGTAPAMVDIETGRDINPHIPEFIEKTPWYVPTAGPTLKHQRPHEERQQTFASLDQWFPKGTTNKVAFKFRKGACENCGAMGHKKRDCFERPRKVGAKFTEEDIAPDDFDERNLTLSYDAKRDRWNGYDPSTYSETVVKEHEEMAEIAKVLKAEKIKKGEIQEDEAEEAAPADDEDKYADDMVVEQSVDMDSRTRITVRNLRIREDTAKYLYNLNENGPYYDPKSRSMRENPFLGVPGKEAEAAKFAGENYVRYTGEVVKANEAQIFAWSARSKGIDVHATAEPTKLEFLQKKVEEQKDTIKDAHMKKLLESYGGEEHLEAPAKELLLAQTESYVEYNRKGKVIKGEDRPMLKSKYEEDKYIGNHTSVWGSYWREGQWGYRCCHSLMKQSYCVGVKGYANDKETFTRTLPMAKQIKPKPAATQKEDEKVDITDVIAKEEKKKAKKQVADSESSSSSSSSESEAENDDDVEAEEDGEDKTEDINDELEREKEKRAKKEHQQKVKRDKRKRQKERRKEKREKEGKKKRKRKSSTSSSSSSSSSDSEPDAKMKKYTPELRAAIKKQMKERKEGKAMKEMDDRDRSYNSQYDTSKAPTSVEVEAYNLTRIHASDPMASYMSGK